MSVIIECARTYCFKRLLVDKHKDVLKMGWSLKECLSCHQVAYICEDHNE